MKMPWNDKIGLAQATAIFAAMFIVSVGLCGANLAIMLRLATVTPGTPPPARPLWASTILIITSSVEILGMLIGAFGLIVVAIVALVSWIKHAAATTKDGN